MHKHNHNCEETKITISGNSDAEFDRICDLADLFKIFGDTTRLRILCSLIESELCVCEISERLSMSPSAISHQLKVLKDSNLVANRREGKTIYYFLADDHVRTIVEMGFEHIDERENENEESL
ncbi:MAG: ArsR/SmtB family transcription factor [Ruminococcus sp.]